MQDEQIKTFRDHEKKVFSQYGEDGIIEYIFSKIKPSYCNFVEIGCGDGRECNTGNLSTNYNWRGFLVDKNIDNIDFAREYYKARQEIITKQVKIIHAFVTIKNINEALLYGGARGSIDLLSIDIDGNDYWIWKEISIIRPRVVVIEYNASLGKDRSLTIKYDPEFAINKQVRNPFYHGASLKALNKLANLKGYILVGCESSGLNAFFVHKEAAENKLVEVSVNKAYYPHIGRRGYGDPEDQFKQIKNLGFEEV